MYGRLSNYISSVAAPFHPFGGAVDIIVVQQQDGTFKGTPWYVRFGKFQGVLKLNEKIVTVSVNGVEADFHMHLLNNGQAYFLREEDSDEEDRSSHSSVEDEVVIASRRESFKSAESIVDIEEQVDSGVGGYGDDELEENKIKASLDADGISLVRQKNGEIFFSFGGRSSNLSDEQFENGLENGNSTSSPMDENDVREPNLEIAVDNRVNLALLPSEDFSIRQEVSAIPLQGEFANGNEIQNVPSHLESSTVKHTKSTFVKIDTVSQTEYKGMVSDKGWNSYKDTSVFRMEESSSTHSLAAGNTSQTDGIVLSRYSTYDYENMELTQSEDVLDFGKAEESSSEVVLMTVDGHVMTAPISSFKHVGSTNLTRGISEDKINPLETLDNNSTENREEKCGLENKKVTNSGNNWQKVAATGKAESIMQTQYGFGISESLLGSERECKQIEQLTNSTNKIEFETHSENHSREFNACCVQSKVDTLQMPRTESEIEFAFNDEEIFKSCLALNELSPATGEEEKQYSLTSPLEKDEGHNLRRSDVNETEPSAALQLDNPQALLAESSHLSDISIKSDFQHLDGSIHDISMKRSRPIHIPRLYTKVGGNAQTSGSLPNLRVPSSSMERAVTEGVFRHSLDINSSFCKQTANNDIYSPRYENTKYDHLRKEKDQAAGASELYSLDAKDTSNKSVQPDVGTDVEISLCRDLLFKGMGAKAAAEAFDSKRVSREVFRSSGAEIIKNEKLVVKISSRYYPWSAAAPIILGMIALGLEAPAEVEGEISVDHVETEAVNDYASNTNPSNSGRWRFWPFTFRRLKTPEKSMSGRSDSQVESVALQSSCDKELELKNGSSKPPQKRKVQTNIPTSEQLASLNLKEGQNMITFTFLTTIWGKQQVDARIYLWKWNTRIVISDVDGTITKSDVLGQVMPLVGKDWTQTGVARLFSAIKENGYQLLFLSARAIVQAYLTRQFLLNLKQDGKALPDGPVVISPDGLFPSLYREVIRRTPHEFKIGCLEDIRLLFPPDCNPFYAGFGNRDTDEISYLKVGIPKGKIFIINPKGEVAVNHSVDVRSYTSLHKLADDMFPPMSTCEQEAFNSWNYWKVPLPDIET